MQPAPPLPDWNCDQLSFLIFGNARGGTPLMQSAQTAGIDLPLKALAWQDPAGACWISYNDPHWIAARHGIANLEPVGAKLNSVLWCDRKHRYKRSVKFRQTPLEQRADRG